MFNKENSIKMNKYFQIVRPEYIFLQLTPNNSIRNYKSSKIAHSIQSLYKTVTQSIYRYEKKYFYECPSKVSYYIYMQKSKVEFYFIVPKTHLGLIKEKIGDTWKGISINQIDTIPNFSKESLCYQLAYEKEDALSLATDKRTNALLSSNLSVLNVMEEDDSVGIFYNFIPSNQFTWKATYQNTINKINNHQPVDKNKVSFSFAFKSALSLVEQLLNSLVSVIEDIGGVKKKKDEYSLLELAFTRMGDKKEISMSTKKKSDKLVLDTQIVLMSDSKDMYRKKNNARALAQSFNTISEDNSLTYRKVKPISNLLTYRLKADTNKISTDECQNLLSLPARELLDEHNCIDKIDIRECELPVELTEGYIRLGLCKYKENYTPAFMSSKGSLANLGLVALGQQGSGKTEFFKNYAKDVISQGEGLIVIDFIKNCDLADTIKSITPKDKLIELDLSKPDMMQGFGYNEIEIIEGMSDFEIIEISNMQTQQTVNFIDSINEEGMELKPRMRRYLTSACNIVYINQGSSLRDVINCLQNHRVRNDFINKIPDSMREYLMDEVNTLMELDETKVNKEDNTVEIVGTKDSKIEHILDRINLLKEDSKLKIMFNKPLDQNIDFVKAMNEGKVILIKMRGDKFSSKYIKNVLVTFFTSKIWISSELRGGIQDKPLRNHVIIDEIFQCPKVLSMWEYILPQCRKFQLKPVFSIHYLSQVTKIKEALKASGCSYMLLQGTDKKNFNELKEELEKHGFTVEDLLNLKQYHSLNLIKTTKGFSAFITKLPDII